MCFIQSHTECVKTLVEDGIKKVLIRFVIILGIFYLLCSCSTSRIITTWKADDIVEKKYNKILVVGIIKDTGLTLRSQIEEDFVASLKDIGYNAISALEEFGVSGLANLSRERTYIVLCNKGVDAVITIALLDKEKEEFRMPPRLRYYSNLYHYHRISDYQIIQADLRDTSAFIQTKSKFLWETIVFDLNTLSPVYTVQTKSFNLISADGLMYDYKKLIIADMLKNKIITKKTEPSIKPAS